MSLARTLLSGGSLGTSINPAKYSHDMGATRIAMESVEELHEIFIESFYNVEQAELAAATEGVDLIGSEYEVVAEGAIGNAFTKIKDFLKKLWDKVKAWFHNVKRYLDSLFMSGKDFVKRYKKDIDNADRTLKDFSFTMYKYDDAKLDNVSKDFDVDGMTENIIQGMLGLAAKGNKDIFWEAGKWQEFEDNAKKAIDEDNLAVLFAKQVMPGSKVKVTSKEDLSEASFAYFRDGATSKEDKEDIDITDLGHYAGILENSKALKEIDSMTTKVDKAYKNAIKEVDNIEKNAREEIKDMTDTEFNSKFERQGDGSDPRNYRSVTFNKKQGQALAKAAQNISTGIARVQSMHNAHLGIWKTALKERDTVYKQLLVAGMSNAKKNAKNK